VPTPGLTPIATQCAHGPCSGSLGMEFDFTECGECSATAVATTARSAAFVSATAGPRASSGKAASFIRQRLSGSNHSCDKNPNVAYFKIVQRKPQMALLLRDRPRWGGRRDGAGRRPGDRPAIRHVSRDRFGRPVPAHVTLRLRSDVPSLRTVPIVREIERTFAAGCERSGFRLVHYSLQSNHAHLIVEASDHATLGRGMMAVGARLARAVNRVAERTGRVLAERYHFRLLRTPREVRNALRYVLLNARRHVGAARARLGSAIRLDPASSARWFDGWKLASTAVPNTIARSAAAHLRPVARARTWLLTDGWRRHGLLDPADVPG